MERYYNIAGVRYRISAPDDQLSSEEGALAAFRAETADWDQWLDFAAADCLDPPSGELVYSDADRTIYFDNENQIRYEGTSGNRLEQAYIRILRCGNHSFVQVRKRKISVQITSKLIQNSMEMEHQIVTRKGILLHAAFIQCGGRAILFTAPSGTGKSTQADLWCRFRNAELINGDRAAVMRDGTTAKAFGIPFSGSSGVSKNVQSPLAAIVYLGQAPQTTVVPLHGSAAFRKVWEGCSVNAWNREDVSTCFQTVTELIESTPVYYMACTPDEQAVLVLERELRNRGVL